MIVSDATDTLPIHDLDALRASVVTLLALKVKTAEIKAMLLQANAPASAWLEAMVVMGKPTTPMRIASALAIAADRSDLVHDAKSASTTGCRTPHPVNMG